MPYAVRLTGHTAAAFAAVFSPDGRLLATTAARICALTRPPITRAERGRYLPDTTVEVCP